MKSIIITGATRGIGYECALQMARLAPNEQIIIACRNVESGKEAIKSIERKTSHQNLKCLPLDVASLKSIKEFKEIFSKEKYNTIISLVNNAGGQNIGATKYTTDGFEETFATNDLGPFYLTLLLLPFMDKEASITFTSSGTHDPAQKTGIEPPVYTTAQELAYPKSTNEEPKIAGLRRYSTSKLCDIMTVYELHRRLADTSIRVNAFDPGMVPGTGLARTYSPLLRFVWKNIMPAMRLFIRNVNSAKKSGTNLANLAFAKQFQNFNGKYFEGAKVIPSSKDSYNRDYQTDLWNTSVRLTHIRQEDTSLQLA